MPVEVVKGSPRVLKNSLPKSLRQVGLQSLQLGRDYAEACFQGTVVIFSQLTRLGNGTPFFKIVLQESKNSPSITTTINTLVFGKLAEDCARLVHQGIMKNRDSLLKKWACSPFICPNSQPALRTTGNHQDRI